MKRGRKGLTLRAFENERKREVDAAELKAIAHLAANPKMLLSEDIIDALDLAISPHALGRRLARSKHLIVITRGTRAPVGFVHVNWKHLIVDHRRSSDAEAA